MPTPVVLRTSARGAAVVRTGELPRTGAAADVALPLGTGLVATGLAFVAAARRRAARAGR
jgi:LPXTG-motif cell wall-anchored protein